VPSDGKRLPLGQGSQATFAVKFTADGMMFRFEVVVKWRVTCRGLAPLLPHIRMQRAGSVTPSQTA
jgi:hypothetical protein